MRITDYGGNNLRERLSDISTEVERNERPIAI